MSSRSTTNPTWALKVGKRILRYLLGTKSHVMVFIRSANKEVTINVFADASFDTEMAQTGVNVYICDGLVEWRSVKQLQVPRSTAEAEVTSLHIGGIVLEGVKALLESMGLRVVSSTLWGDNAASIFLTQGQGSWKTRCLANRAAGLRSRVESGDLVVSYVGTKDQRADGLTKCLPVPATQRMREQLCLYPMP